MNGGAIGTQSTPVTEARNGVAIGTRNGDGLSGKTLEQLEARLAALDRSFVGNVPPKLREARRRQHAAAKHGRSCGRCGEPFHSNQTAYLAGLGLGARGQLWPGARVRRVRAPLPEERQPLPRRHARILRYVRSSARVGVDRPRLVQAALLLLGAVPVDPLQRPQKRTQRQGPREGLRGLQGAVHGRQAGRQDVLTSLQAESLPTT